MSKLNVLPDWWSFSFIGLQVAALLPLTVQHLADPVKMFMGNLPNGYDAATDRITSSVRVELAGIMGAQAYPMIASLFIGCTLFARNSLRGQPKLQQRLVKLPVWVGLASDIWLLAALGMKLPPQVLLSPSLWTPSIKGIMYGIPMASALKLLWIFGVGRDVV